MFKIFSFGLLLGALVISSFAQATPSQILMIRHAEKPATGNDLDKAGRARAEALVGFFETDPRMLQYGTPVAIYAMAPKKNDGSMRPIETVTPLANSLGLVLIEKYTRQEYAAAAQEILNKPEYEGKMVLICWEHDVIPDFADALGVSNAPAWPDQAFDRVWKIDYENNQVSSFQDLPQHLMPGDSAQ